ncbi:SPASM domain-containing protein [Rhodocytophaga rosea]|uniref:SPASM domain-containing protein n=1 Tax=Rhodocytophaga rosea TaxID=2704465 RepID=A0A6C0GRA8_9BACT|nr:radical SAM protein [Rhodocytophaga rosea]QHT70030.1 SPASM domain-containing protein [Rhodocytophaga rosea]
MHWKLSHYLIVSDPIINDRFQILYSTRTAQRLLLSTTVVENILKNNLTAVSEEIIAKLVSFEILVPSEEDELNTVINRNTTAIAQDDTLYYVIQPTAQCQLGCNYCGQKHTSTYLQEELDIRILQRIEQKLQNQVYTHLAIGWFGAEPLLGAKQIERLSASLYTLAQTYGCTYGAKVVTNGLNLKLPLFRKLLECHIQTIEITLDGSARFHDQRRHTKSGHSTFDIIFNNLQRVLALEDFESLGIQINIRCNVDVNNYEGVPELIELVSSHKLLSRINKFYFAPIHDWGNDAHLLALSKDEFAKMETGWLIALHQKGFIRNQVPTETHPIVCLSLQREAEVIDAKGNVYNCTEVPYVPAYENSEYLIENLTQPDIKAASPRSFSQWNQEILAGQFPCHGCKILPICGGACPKSWHEQVSPCPSIKFNIKDRLVLDAYAALKKPAAQPVP